MSRTLLHALTALLLLLLTSGSSMGLTPEKGSTPSDVALDTPTKNALEAEAEPEPEEDPYAGYETWCESLHKTVCECPERDPIECERPTEACSDDRTGREQKCIRPRWARNAGAWTYRCYPRWLRSSEQRTQREVQRLIVEQLCKPPAWADDLEKWGTENKMGDDPSKLCWRLKGGSKALGRCRTGHFCQPKKLAEVLALVAARESSWDNATSHELNRDVTANRISYAKAKERGWYEGNPHFSQQDRWERGYGWHGFNAALHVRYWDPKAPPEILCRQVESTEVYLRKARHAFRKLWSMYGDKRERVYALDTGEAIAVKGVTWYDIHRAVSTGSLTPAKIITTRKWSNGSKKWVPTGFVGRARTSLYDIDPFESVMWEMLGDGIPPERQNEIAEEIRQSVRRHFEPEEPELGTDVATR